MVPGKSPLMSRLAIVLLGVTPVAGAMAAAVERLWWFVSGPRTYKEGANLVTGLVGLALLVLPQLLLEGFVGETVWVATSATSLVLAIALVTWSPARNLVAGAGWATLVAAVLVLVGPAVWWLWFSEAGMLWWVNHANVWAAMAAMVMAGTIPLYSAKLRHHPLVWLTLAAVAVAAATGSRTALFAVAAGTVASVFRGAPAGLKGWRGALTLVVIVGVVVLVVQASPLRARLAGLVPAPTENLVIASEQLDGRYWTSRGVEVLSELGDDALRTFRISSTAGEPLDRVHQRFVLPADGVRTLTFEFRGGSGGGVVAFSEPTGSLTVPFEAVDESRAAGNPEIVQVAMTPGDDGWVTANITVRNTGLEPVVWRAGLSPSLRGSLGAEMQVRYVRMSRGADDLGYSPTDDETRARELAALSASQRMGYARGAWELLKERPLFGHGTSRTFYELLDQYSLRSNVTGTDQPWHAHSLLGDLAVRFGGAGILGFLLIIVGAVQALPVGRRSDALPFLVVVLVLGVGDATFFKAGGSFVMAHLLLAANSQSADPRRG